MDSGRQRRGKYFPRFLYQRQRGGGKKLPEGDRLIKLSNPVSTSVRALREFFKARSTVAHEHPVNADGRYN